MKKNEQNENVVSYINTLTTVVDDIDSVKDIALKMI